MKTNSQILFLLLFLSTNLFAQTDPKVYLKGVNCSTQFDGNCFYNLEPSDGNYSTTYDYEPVIEFPSSSTVPTDAVKTYAWTVVGGTVTTQTDELRVRVKWNNTANYSSGSPTKTIRVKVTFKWTPQGGTQQTKEINSIIGAGGNTAQTIEVRYISTPSTITFNSSTLSNGNSLQYSCGTASKTVSVPAVTTDPYGTPVTYYFYYPSGWSGPASSSTPSVTVNPHASSGGAITVEAKRSDSNVRTKISITITRPLPSISSISPSSTPLVCNSSDVISASATGFNADKYVWTPTGGAQVNGNTSAQTVAGSVNLSATTNGSYTIRAYSTVCNATSTNSKTLNIQYGIQAPPTQIFSPTYLCQNYEAAFYVNPVANVTSYDWSVSGYGAVLASGQGSSQIMAKSIYTTPVTVSVSAVNACGPSSPISKTVETRYCENDWLVAPDPNPNPATNYRLANTGNPKQLALAPDEIKVYNENGKVIDNLKGNNVSDTFKKQFLVEGRKAELNVKDLPGGTYYFHLMKNGKVIEKVRVVLK